MSLHNQIMNIKTQIGPDCGNPFDYKLGHRDARHDAAELSLKYERYIEKLEAVYENWPIIAKLRKEFGL